MNYMTVKSGDAVDKMVCDSYRALHLIHRQLVRAEVDGDGLAHHKLAILAMVAHAGAISPSEIARRLSLTKSQLTQFIDQLVKQAAVTRVADETDRRRQKIVLTENGRSLLGDYLGALRRTLSSKLTVLSPGDTDRLSRALTDIIEITSRLERV